MSARERGSSFRTFATEARPGAGTALSPREGVRVPAGLARWQASLPGSSRVAEGHKVVLEAAGKTWKRGGVGGKFPQRRCDELPKQLVFHSLDLKHDQVSPPAYVSGKRADFLNE